MHVIILSHTLLGAVYLMGLLREECQRRVKRWGRGDKKIATMNARSMGSWGGEDHGVGDNPLHGN